MHYVLIGRAVSFKEEEKKSFAMDPKTYLKFRRVLEHEFNVRSLAL